MKAALRWMPRLAAEEATDDASRVAVGTGAAGEKGKTLLTIWLQQSKVPGREEPGRQAQRPARTVEAVRAAGLKVFAPAPPATT